MAFDELEASQMCGYMLRKLSSSGQSRDKMRGKYTPVRYESRDMLTANTRSFESLQEDKGIPEDNPPMPS